MNFLSAALLSGRLRAYLDILIVGSGARIFGLASRFVVLVILSQFLSKAELGDLMTAFGFYRLSSVALDVGGAWNDPPKDRLIMLPAPGPCRVALKACGRI